MGGMGGMGGMGVMGGVLLAVKSDLNPTPCLILNIIPSEGIWVKISSKGHVQLWVLLSPSRRAL